MQPDLKKQIRDLPGNPGVYRYYDAEGKLLYIGKARNLKKRVASYFTTKNDVHFRTRLMVSKIRRIEYAIVNTENDALLLENSLIKKYQPRYNVLLKDDKSYPFVVIKNEPFPRVFPMRNPIRDGSEYYGPYVNVVGMKFVLELIRKVFQVRSCSLNLTEQNIKAHKFRVCLDYHIGLCKGPCEGLQTKEDYMQNIQQIRNILKGNTNEVIKFVKRQVDEASEKLDFEKAQMLAEKLESLERFQAKSTVVNPDINNVDVFAIYSNEQYAFVNYLKVANGTIIRTDTIEFGKRMDESDSEIITMAIVELREKYQSNSDEIIVPFPLLYKEPGVKFLVPKLGDKKKLLELSRKNAFYYYQERLKSTELNKDRRKNMELLEQAKRDLDLKEIPFHIECFDNSNLQGTEAVSAIIVFKNGIPSKKDYRIFNVKTVDGPDDFATMEEAVYRRYKRMLDEKTPLPQLIIIDGGKGQVSAAMNSIEKLGLKDKVDLIGIAKKLEDIFKPDDLLPLSINKKSQTLRLIQRARDEAHRFGITRHRQKRINTNLRSGIEEIKGIGKATTEKLLAHFKSIKKLKEAPAEEIEKVIGKSRTKILLDTLKEENPS